MRLIAIGLIILLFSTLVYTAEDVIIKQVTKASDLYAVCKEYLGTWNNVMQTRVTLLNANKIYWLTGENVILPVERWYKQIDIMTELYTIDEVSNMLQITPAKLKELNPNVVYKP